MGYNGKIKRDQHSSLKKGGYLGIGQVLIVRYEPNAEAVFRAKDPLRNCFHKIPQLFKPNTSYEHINTDSDAEHAHTVCK